MRSILIISSFLLAFSADLVSQVDFKSLNERTYNYYLNGDLKNLGKAADSLLSQGMDYYYLRMRLGIVSFTHQRYGRAFRNFAKALEFNDLDTLSREYIYKCYLFSGRKNDAGLYLNSLADYQKNSALKSLGKIGYSEIFFGSAFLLYDEPVYQLSNLNFVYAGIKSNLSFNAGIEGSLSPKLQGTLAFTNFRKEGLYYSEMYPAGAGYRYQQNQVYAKLNYSIFPGWELSGFGQAVIFTDPVINSQSGTGMGINYVKSEYTGGVGLSKKSWKIRTDAGLSFSNFANSRQIRGECSVTWLPAGNLNFYLISAWMGQTDKNWGGTYQVNQEAGFKVFKKLWIEVGILKGNSFLYSRSQGYIINNSFLIPSGSVYGSIIILPWKHFSITFNPYFNDYQNYSWDLTNFKRTGLVTHNSFGALIKLTYKK